MSDWFTNVGIGVLLGTFSKAISSFGLVLQKRAHLANQRLAPAERRHYCANCSWIVGFLTYFAGNLIAIAALTMAPQAVVASLDALVPVFTSIYAPFFLEEQVKTRQWIANVWIVVGVTLTVVSGPQEADDPTVDDLIDYLKDTLFLVWLISCHSIAFTGIAVQTYGPDCWPSMQDAGTLVGKLTAVSAGAVPAVLSSFLQIWSKICGLFVGKIVAHGEYDNFEKWQLYLFLALLLLFNTLEVFRLQRGLMMYPAVVVVTTFQVCLVAFAVVGGGIYFKEFDGFGQNSGEHWRPPVFGAGLCIAMCGVFFATQGDDEADPKELQHLGSFDDAADPVGLGRRAFSAPSPPIVRVNTPADIEVRPRSNTMQNKGRSSPRRKSFFRLLPQRHMSYLPIPGIGASAFSMRYAVQADMRGWVVVESDEEDGAAASQVRSPRAGSARVPPACVPDALAASRRGSASVASAPRRVTVAT
eukprot:TRINITY_DN12803_c0_g1_i1.p1 TRINITY_DN12803_c0_g1~~TRINITY_DN12803_c0_g1_i1.p1  ORF type:complete len:472 (+),score=71.20 TRINITY_DN12803_c0_g1_i1:69-1484(+)